MATSPLQKFSYCIFLSITIDLFINHHVTILTNIAVGGISMTMGAGVILGEMTTELVYTATTATVRKLFGFAPSIEKETSYRTRLLYRSVDFQHVIHEIYKDLITSHITDQDKYISHVLFILLLAFVFYGIAWIIEKRTIPRRYEEFIEDVPLVENDK